MITRFRLEAREQTREDVSRVLAEAAKQIMEISGINMGLWRCTDDVVERSGASYRGRVVWKAELYPRAIRSRDTISEGEWEEIHAEEGI